MFDIKPALFIFQCTCSLATACLFYHIVFSLSRLFQKFFEKVFNFLSTRTLFFPCSLALSTDDLIIIHSITPFVNTFWKFFYAFLVSSRYSSFHRHLFPISYKVFPVFVSRTPLFHPKFLFPKEKHKISFVIFSKRVAIFFFSP